MTPWSLVAPRAVRQFCTGPLCRHKASANTSVDELCVPLKATWSVAQLLSTYPAPELSDATFARLHRLAALDPPDSASQDKQTLKMELQELLRLVEAVNRIWAEGRGMDLDAPMANHIGEVHGEALLKHAKKHIDGHSNHASTTHLE
ncbi:hypothetical protein OPQ81_004548 [Rhizoctonia solani]|nr:hypothetical protein OPQ81_004548 [Rhizoctonia solani]